MGSPARRPCPEALSRLPGAASGVTRVCHGGPVPTYVALLRAINLGARNKVAMAELRSMFEAVGADDVRTHVQSGNVVFRSPVGTPSELEQTLEGAITETFGLDIRVLVRTAREIVKIDRSNPFADKGDLRTLHLTFSAEPPAADRVRDLGNFDFGPDRFSVAGREIYLLCPDGYGRTKLNNAFLEKKLGVAATTRNWKTVTTLAEMAAG